MPWLTHRVNSHMGLEFYINLALGYFGSISLDKGFWVCKAHFLKYTEHLIRFKRHLSNVYLQLDKVHMGPTVHCMCLPCYLCVWEAAGGNPSVCSCVGRCLSECPDCQPGPKPLLCPARTASPGHSAAALRCAGAGSVAAAQTFGCLSRKINRGPKRGKINRKKSLSNPKITQKVSHHWNFIAVNGTHIYKNILHLWFKIY